MWRVDTYIVRVSRTEGGQSSLAGVVEIVGKGRLIPFRGLVDLQRILTGDVSRASASAIRTRRTRAPAGSRSFNTRRVK